MSIPLRVLIVEDSPDDAELVARELRRGGYEPSLSRVETEEGLMAALRSGTWDLVISDHSLPGFNGLKALELVRRHDPDVPFVVVSGTIGEDAAVAEMKAGAHDYVMKGNLRRLAAAVERELRDAEVRRERRRAEVALSYSELRYRTLVEVSPDAVFVNRGDRIVFVNSACVRLFGAASPEALLGRLPLELFHPDFHSMVKKRIDSMLETGEPAPTIEEQIVRRDGRIVDVEVTAAPFSDEGTSAIKVILRDITARKQAELELKVALRKAEESDRLKHAFLANMSHEVRTPLNVITGFASLIDDHLREVGDHSQDELFEGLRRSSKRLIDTIHGLLDLSSIETGAFSVKPKRIELSSFLQEQIDRFTLAASSKGLSLDLEVEGDGAEVTFDPYCLTHILENLLDNAIKFSERGGVTVCVHRGESGALCLSVRDTGVGIDPGYVPHLFERFSQEESGYTRRFEGAGIGLALVKRYVEMNQAEISLQTEKGAGTTFTIRFASGASAAAPGRAALATPSPGITSTAAAQRPVVLVVEDDDPTQDFLAVALRGDFDLLRAFSAEEARAHLAAHPDVAVVLMDLSLRGNEDGLMLTRWMRAQPRWRDMPIIATTAHAMAQDRENALEAGCTAYLAKPISRAELLSAIRQVSPRAASIARACA